MKITLHPVSGSNRNEIGQNSIILSCIQISQGAIICLSSLERRLQAFYCCS